MNCMIVDDDELSRNIVEDLIVETDFLTLTNSCDNPVDAFNILRKEQVDLIFLDVEMPKMSGIEMIKNLNPLPQIILITSHSEYALESYEYDVTDFILKPVSHPRFLKAVSKAKERFESKQGKVEEQDSKTIFIKTDSKLVQVNTEDILWVEALGNYVMIKTSDKKYTVHNTMKEMESKLPSNNFIRVHRSFIVRLDKIESIEDNIAVISNKLISIGGAYKDELNKRLNFL